MKRLLFSLFYLLFTSYIFCSQANIVTEEGAWCWFADPRALHYESKDGGINMTYMGYIDVHGNIKAMQYDHNGKNQTEVLVRSYFQPDDHDNPTFLVLPDERVMIFYSRHTDEPCFYYRISRVPGDITTFGAEHKILTKNNTTYPSPFLMSDDPDHFYLCWRGINWHPTIAQISIPDKNDELTVTWGPYQIVQSTGARPYAKYDSNGKDQITLAYTTGHPDNEDPNYIYYNVIDINSKELCDVNGKVLSRIEDGPFPVNKTDEFVSANPTLIVDASHYRDWISQLTADSDGQPLIAMTRISKDKKSHNYYLAKWNGKEWTKKFIAHAGGHFHQSPEIEHCYTGGMAIDTSNPHSIYCSVPIDGAHGRVYEIVEYTIDDNGEIISTSAITSNSEKNNVRPYVIPDSPIHIAWMQGDYYDWIVSQQRPQGYPTSIMCDFEGYSKPQRNKGGMIPEKFDIKEDFSFTVDIETANADKKGVLVDMGQLQYAYDPATLLPEVRLGKKSYQSSNRLATSDCWTQQNRGTGGQWYDPVPMQRFNLRMVYHNGTLTTYVNNRVDQSIVLAAPAKLVEVAEGWSSTSVNTAIFRNNSIVSKNGKQFIAYYDQDGYVVLGKRNIGQNKWTLHRTQYKGNINDGHNVISLGIDGDGYLHVSFDHHGHPLRYCRSLKPYGLEVGALDTMDAIDIDNVTYPEFYNLSGGDLLFAYRSGSSGRGNLVMKRYITKNKGWETLHTSLIDGEDQRNAYWQLCTDSEGTIHVSWVWRETWMVETNHDICYARSRDGGLTWEKSDGSKQTLPITAENAEYAVKIPQSSELINQTSMVTDGEGHPYIATYWRDQDSEIPQYRLVWNDGSEWHTAQVSNRTMPFSLSGGGTKMIPISRPRLATDGKRAYYIFRDAERGSKVSMACTNDLNSGQWTTKDLTDFSVGAWEPSFDTQLWAKSHQLHLFVQPTLQGDGERVISSAPTTVSVLEVN